MSRPLRLIRRVLVTICSVAVFAAAVAQARGGLLAQPSMAPGLAIVAMVAAVGGLLLVDSGVRHGSAGLRMPLLAAAGGLAMLWADERADARRVGEECVSTFSSRRVPTITKK